MRKPVAYRWESYMAIADERIADNSGLYLQLFSVISLTPLGVLG